MNTLTTNIVRRETLAGLLKAVRANADKGASGLLDCIEFKFKGKFLTLTGGTGHTMLSRTIELNYDSCIDRTVLVHENELRLLDPVLKDKSIGSLAIELGEGSMNIGYINLALTNLDYPRWRQFVPEDKGDTVNCAFSLDVLKKMVKSMESLDQKFINLKFIKEKHILKPITAKFKDTTGEDMFVIMPSTPI